MKKLQISIMAILVITIMASAACKKDENAINQIIVTPDTPVTDFDGNSYRTVKIGKQIWMAENLKSTHYSDGSSTPSFVYGNNEANLNTYGRLYSSSAVMKGSASSNSNPSLVKGIAPVGWHVPSKAEWQQLADYLGGLSIAGGRMKEEGTTHWITPNTSAVNESLFSALPAGMYAFWDEYQWIGDHCVFATSTANPSDAGVFSIMLQNSSASMVIGNFHPSDASSVRCIKD